MNKNRTIKSKAIKIYNYITFFTTVRHINLKREENVQIYRRIV